MNSALPLGWRIRALLAASVLPPLLELVSFDRLQHRLTILASRRWQYSPDAALVARWVDDTLGRLPPPWKRTCLRRATVLYYLLRRSGHVVDLCIGVRRDEHGVLLAHAWLVRDGVPYVEPAATELLLPSYGVIARFPTASTSA